MIAMTAENHGIDQQTEPSHILIVDDDKVNRLLLHRVLQNFYHVAGAQDGEEALALLAREPFDVVLLDIMMPGKSGLDVLEVIRRTPEIADLPVILVSALTDSESVVHGLTRGANDYISKPIDADMVLARVNTQLALKKLMDDNKRVIAELEQAQTTRDRLFRMASHDLKAPLTNIRMAEFILREIIGEDASGREVLDMMYLSVENMFQIIEEFLDVAALQSGKLDLHLQPVSIEAIIAEVGLQYHVTALNKQIALEFGDMPGVVLADAPRLTQVIGNLVSNALKYSERHTTVTIWSELVEDRVRICVADQGPGIPPEEQPLLFNEFSKLTPRPTANESSTGVGLWIVKHLAALHNGGVGVDCPPDGGSIFWVELPAAPSKPDVA